MNLFIIQLSFETKQLFLCTDQQDFLVWKWSIYDVNEQCKVYLDLIWIGHIFTSAHGLPDDIGFVKISFDIYWLLPKLQGHDVLLPNSVSYFLF